MARQHFLGRCAGERGGQLRQPGGGYEVVGESAQQRVGRAHGGTGQRQVGAELPRGGGEEVCTAHVGDEADAGLGHGDAGAFGDDAHASVGGEADSAAHHDAVHEGHVGLRVAGDPRVQPVLVAPEALGGVPAGLRVVVDGPDVPAGAQPALAGAAEEDLGDGGVLLPGVQRLGDP